MVFKLTPLPRTLPAALRDVQDRKFEVRLSAVKDLGRLALGSDRRAALEALRAALTDDPAPGVRAEAAVALADAEATECVNELLDACTDVHQRVGQMALLALGEVSDAAHPETCRVIEEAVGSEAPQLRFQALIALHRLRGAQAMDGVAERMTDEDAQVRYIAVRIAEELWLGRTSPGELPGAVYQRVRHRLEDEAVEVRLAAAILLARAGDGVGGDQMVDVLNRFARLKEPEDEQAAIELVGELGLRGARAGLRRRAWGGLNRHPMAWQAQVALARLGDPRARSIILRGLGAWTRDARTQAVAAAGQARLTQARERIAAMRGRAHRADPRAVAEALARLEPE